jgi:hypothetical protein
VKLLPGFVLRRFVPAVARETGTHARTTRRRWERRHLRTALWFLAAFAASQFVLAVWVERTPTIRDPEYTLLRNRLRQRAAEQPEKPIAIFMGSSRVAYGFDPASTANGSAALFNFGVPGAGPYLVDVLHGRLSADGVQPHAVFLEVLPAFYNTAGVRTLDNSLLDGARLSAEEAFDLLTYSDRPSGPLRRWAQDRAVPISRHRTELRKLTGLEAARDNSLPIESLRDIGSDGFRVRLVPPNERVKLTALAHKQYDPFCGEFRLAEKAFERLLGTIRRARANGATVVAVVMPEGNEFRCLYSPSALAGVSALLDRLRNEAGVDVVDARDWLPDEAFFDQHHLTPEGAAIFSARFQRDIFPLAFPQR